MLRCLAVKQIYHCASCPAHSWHDQFVVLTDFHAFERTLTEHTSYLAAGYGAISQYFLVNPDPEQSIDFGTAMFAVSLTTNVFVTALTIGRIWWKSRSITRSMGRSSQSPYRNLILLLIESGSVIAIAKLLEFILFEISGSGIGGLNALYIVFDMIPQINGIMPTLIIITVNAGQTITDAQHSASLSTFKANGVSADSSTIMFGANNPSTGQCSTGGRDFFVGYKDGEAENSERIALENIAQRLEGNNDEKV